MGNRNNRDCVVRCIGVACTRVQTRFGPNSTCLKHEAHYDKGVWRHSCLAQNILRFIWHASESCDLMPCGILRAGFATVQLSDVLRKAIYIYIYIYIVQYIDCHICKVWNNSWRMMILEMLKSAMILHECYAICLEMKTQTV